MVHYTAGETVAIRFGRSMYNCKVVSSSATGRRLVIEHPTVAGEEIAMFINEFGYFDKKTGAILDHFKQKKTG